MLDTWGPIDLIAGPSGYGLPLVRGEDVGEAEIDLMALTRPDERGRASGVIGFRAWVRALLATGLPTVFLPGGIHLPTIPAHRKANAIDMGTPDKIAVVALALAHTNESNFAVLEIGSAFTALLAVSGRAVVDAAAGSHGPIGMKSSGVWDGEAAYWFSPLAKNDLFRGGWDNLGDWRHKAFAESLRKHVSALRSVTQFDIVYLSGAGLERDDVREIAIEALADMLQVRPIPAFADVWVKHAAQGAAVLADGLAGGQFASVVEDLAIRRASGTILDYLRHRPEQENTP